MTIEYRIPDVLFPHREVPQPYCICDGCGLSEFLFPAYGVKIGGTITWEFAFRQGRMVNWCGDECRGAAMATHGI